MNCGSLPTPSLNSSIMPAFNPELSVKVSISSTTYSFSDFTPPTLALTIESLADRPLTLFTWHTPFDPASGMTQGCFSIIDIASNLPVPQTVIRVQRGPISRARGSGDEKCFLTLQPHVPTIVSTEFSRGAGKRPQPRAVVERGWELDEQGNEMKIRRGTKGCGVDGLEPGHEYKVDVAKGSLMGIWWRWGTKEEILVEPGSLHWNLSDLAPEQSPLEIGNIEGVNFSVAWDS